MYYKRTLSTIVKNASDTFPAVLINAPRQVGKTTLFEHAMNKKELTYLLTILVLGLLQKLTLLYFSKHIHLQF
jgi:predicted AAA+ superfamily ATPase